MWYLPISWSFDKGALHWLWSSCMVPTFCRRGSVIPICLYLLVGRYMKERKSGLRNESSKTKRARLFHRNTAAYIYKKIIKKKKKELLQLLHSFWLSYIKKSLPPSNQISLYHTITRSLNNKSPKWVFKCIDLLRASHIQCPRYRTCKLRR